MFTLTLLSGRYKFISETLRIPGAQLASALIYFLKKVVISCHGQLRTSIYLQIILNFVCKSINFQFENYTAVFFHLYLFYCLSLFSRAQL